MDAFIGYMTVLVLFVLLAAPALAGHARERRIDRQLKGEAAARRARKSSSRPGLAGLGVLKGAGDGCGIG